MLSMIKIQTHASSVPFLGAFSAMLQKHAKVVKLDWSFSGTVVWNVLFPTALCVTLQTFAKVVTPAWLFSKTTVTCVRYRTVHCATRQTTAFPVKQGQPCSAMLVLRALCQTVINVLLQMSVKLAKRELLSDKITVFYVPYLTAFFATVPMHAKVVRAAFL